MKERKYSYVIQKAKKGEPDSMDGDAELGKRQSFLDESEDDGEDDGEEEGGEDASEESAQVSGGAA